MDDGTIDLSIMHKIVREMTGTLLVGSLLKQAINLQGNNNDSSQGNKGHPLLPIVINLTYSSIGWKKNASSPTTQESYTGGASTSQLDMQSSLFTEERIQFQFFILAIFLLCLWRWAEIVNAVMVRRNSLEQVGKYYGKDFQQLFYFHHLLLQTRHLLQSWEVPHIFRKVILDEWFENYVRRPTPLS